MSRTTSGCRYNAFYPEDQAPQLAPATYKLDLSGAIRDERPWRVDQLSAAASSQITRPVRVEGYPMKIRIPTKLGFKNPKSVVASSVTNNYPGGFWEDFGYNWFSGS
jgi:DMSO/TMAO reductase YedYZ molybdopterin-dependent catalytic subunit